MNCATELSGTVRTINGNGFKVAGREAWLNFSKFASLTMPAVGQRVLVGLDKSGYVRGVEVEGEPDAQAAPGAPVDRDACIMRQAVLNTATAILSTADGAVDVDALLSLAARLEAWVLR